MALVGFVMLLVALPVTTEAKESHTWVYQIECERAFVGQSIHYANSLYQTPPFVRWYAYGTDVEIRVPGRMCWAYQRYIHNETLSAYENRIESFTAPK